MTYSHADGITDQTMRDIRAMNEKRARERLTREQERGLGTGRMTPLHVGDTAYIRLSGDTITVKVADVRGDHLIDVTGNHFMLRNVVGHEPAPVESEQDHWEWDPAVRHDH